MTRRDFLRISGSAAVATAAGCVDGAAAVAAAMVPPTAIDVFVYGSTPSGIAAALEAARRGCRVVLACPKSHVGGMLASGLGGLDAKRGDLQSGFVLEFRQAMRDLYQRRADAGAPEWQLKAPRRGGNEPSAVEAMFSQMLAVQAERLAVWSGHHLLTATTHAGRIIEVECEAPNGSRRQLTAQTFIDATYEGDLAAAARVPCRIGRESRDEFGESLAGIIYVDAKDGRELVTSDSGAASPAIQAYCARCVFTTDPERMVPFEKPATYEQHQMDLWPWLADFESGRIQNRTYGKALPGQKWELNGSIDQQTSLNCPGISWAWPEADRRRRATLAQFHVDHAASFFWFLQNEPRLPERVRAQWKLAGRHRDEFPDNGHWPFQIYVRQGRRIEGRARVTQHNFTVDRKLGRTPRVEHPIAIGDYSVDVHPCHDRRHAIRGLMEGAIWYRTVVPSPTQPGQIPYSAMLPRTLDNLLVPVCLSSSHIGMAVVRMEPVWMITGQVAGLAAAEAKDTRRDVAQIDPASLPARARLITDPGPAKAI
ncbi:MAG: FAD-dependent oxidoreductase [Opitutus sp.]|nr:FAD-dependent oxidoreductase [Opitutus sp.]